MNRKCYGCNGKGWYEIVLSTGQRVGQPHDCKTCNGTGELEPCTGDSVTEELKAWRNK